MPDSPFEGELPDESPTHPGRVLNPNIWGGGWRVKGGGWRVKGGGCRVEGVGCRV